MQRAAREWILGGYPRLRISVMIGVVLGCLVFAAGAFATGDINTAPGEVCPNEASPGFRSTLPDCRAYEQVSPGFKQGYEPIIEAVSGEGEGEGEGEHLVMRSLGALAGLEGGDTDEGAKFELSRSPSGWEISPLSLSTSRFPAQQLVAVSSDLTETLFSARGPEESVVADNFYLREADGAITEIGALLPPAATAGPPAGEYDSFKKGLNEYTDASSDLSHVFYRMPRPLFEKDAWPGDTTVGSESLLEYSGTDNSEPELVGVKPGPREEEAKPSDNPSLISTCGTSLGSLGSQDLYNAVSADGASVFFTAVAPPFECATGVVGEGPEVNELYARLGGRETVTISEPSSGQCAACDTGVKAPAEFAGASEDGSKVFFMTDQELFAGDSSSNLYEYDFDGPVGNKVERVSVGSVAPEVQGVARVSEDGSHVYFVARGVLTSEPDRSLAMGEQQPVAGEENLYVFQQDMAFPAGRVSFIATLCTGEEASGAQATGVTQCPSAESDVHDWQGPDVRPVQATPDGRFVVFESVADLTAGDTSVLPQIFEYDALTGELVRVSRGADDDEPQGTQSADENRAETRFPSYSESSSPAGGKGLAVSGDGATVVFASAGALTREARPGVVGAISTLGAYEYRSSVGDGGSIDDGDVYLLREPSPGVPQLDASARDVFFPAGESLVPSDTDTQFDLYDARVDGGFPALVSPVECGGAGCAPAVAEPMLGAPASAGVAGGGNLAPPPPPPRVVVVKPGLTRAQKLARALKLCRRDRKKTKRDRCEKAARKRYGVAKKASNERGAGR